MVNKALVAVLLPAVFGPYLGYTYQATQKQPVVVIGKTNQRIDESSQVASESIDTSVETLKSGQRRIMVHYVLRNRTDHTLYIGGDTFTFDLIRDNGERASETETGCENHFFSSCHNNVADSREDIPVLGPRELAAGKSMEDTLNLNVYYMPVEPGRYRVTGYVCGLEAGKCFRSNTVTTLVK
jgi:hypothetical protein